MERPKDFYSDLFYHPYKLNGFGDQIIIGGKCDLLKIKYVEAFYSTVKLINQYWNE